MRKAHDGNDKDNALNRLYHWIKERTYEIRLQLELAGEGMRKPYPTSFPEHQSTERVIGESSTFIRTPDLNLIYGIYGIGSATPNPTPTPSQVPMPNFLDGRYGFFGDQHELGHDPLLTNPFLRKIKPDLKPDLEEMLKKLMTSYFNTIYSKPSSYAIPTPTPTLTTTPPLLGGALIRPQTLEDRLGKAEDVDRELEFVAFEAAEVYKFLMQLKERADKLGRGLVIVGNQSYGELAVLPVKALLEQRGVTVYSARVPSSGTGEHTIPDIAKIPQEIIRQLVTDQPLVAVVDGTATPASGEYIRYSKAMIGYVNMVAAVNEALGLPTRLGIIPEDQFMRLRGRQDFQTLVEHMHKLAESGTSPMTYELGFWNPHGSEGSLNVFSMASSRDKVVLPIDVKQLNGPAMVLMTSTAPANSQIYFGRGLPQQHISGYFDDRPWQQIERLEERLRQMAAKHLPKAE